MKKILVFVVAYQAEKFIEDVLNRISGQIRAPYSYEILVIDDCSKDRTYEITQKFVDAHPDIQITNLYNPINQGYGGNQQIGYQYAIDHNFDVVVLLHGDGQYPPEYINEMAEPILSGDFDVMLGSRMKVKSDALRGGMPLYKWVGNQILTWSENVLLKQKLSEYHTGFRAYKVDVLQQIPFKFNSKYYDFDTDIIIQIADNHYRIGEIPIPTKYGDEICRVNGMKYAKMIMKSCVESRIMRFGLFYNPKFDYGNQSQDQSLYKGKFGLFSTHQFTVDLLASGSNVLDLGAGPGYMAKALKDKNITVTSVDRIITQELEAYSKKTIQADLNELDLSEIHDQFNYILLLDILEFLDSPEKLLQQIRDSYAPDHPQVIISTGNVAFCITRLSLFLGKFNYGRLGILELKKKRLFTQNSLIRILKDNGYQITTVKGIPAPYQKAVPNHQRLSSFLQHVNNFLIHISKGLFAYQIVVIAKPVLTLPQLLENAKRRKSLQ